MEGLLHPVQWQRLKVIYLLRMRFLNWRNRVKVFLQLLKMRILSVFKGSGKKDKYKKNIGFKVFIGIVVAYAALCFVGMFGFYFMQLAENFVEQEVGFAYFSMVAVVMVAIGFVTTVFAAQSQIFEAKDNDLLTAMPIPPRYILLTRVITLLIVELAESLVLGIEAMLIYKILHLFLWAEQL